MFEEFFKNKLSQSPLYTSKNKHTQESYKGIIRREHPKWKGWGVIKLEKAKGLHITKIESLELNILVKNFYYVLYLDGL